jgi:hypothetical protein
MVGKVFTPLPWVVVGDPREVKQIWHVVRLFGLLCPQSGQRMIPSFCASLGGASSLT